MSGHDMSGHDMSGHDMSGHDMSGHDMSGHDVALSVCLISGSAARNTCQLVRQRHHWRIFLP